MTTVPAAEDQSAQIALLLDPATHGGDGPRRIDTHGAIVVLAGDRVLKMKRAVRFPFLDYSTPERRRAACAKELAINRRTAPELYLGVRPILAGPGGRPQLGPRGEGAPQQGAIDWVVEMRRFDDDALLDQRARDGRLDEATMLSLADAVAGFHRAAARRPEHGGRSAMARIVEGIVEGLEGDAALDAGKVARFRGASASRLAHDGALLDARRDAGYARHGHGDLHLGNVCLWRGRPTLFDAIEFDDRIASGDVLYDLAFLLMDLAHRGLDRLANAAFNRYLVRAVHDDGVDALAGLGALPLFLACRAGIRAQVSLAAARAQPDAAQAEARRAEARAYLDLALDCLDPPPPRLVAIGGISGTGKSTLAHAIAPALGARPGAVVLRSDVFRKLLSGADLFQRLPQSAYAAAVTEQVFDALARAAEIVLDAGHAAVADAVYLMPAQRDRIAAVAHRRGVAFAGLWLEAPQAELERRVTDRRHDVSDAGAEVVRWQSGLDPGRLDWSRIDAGQAPPAVAAAARSALSSSRG
ncbi:MAG: AAA family ATPase [Alphaproteobacteria bacterium]|nr:AAA family ATPase [Alphaproteobacteria bacterium]